MHDSFYNTTHERGADLKKREVKAESQEARVLRYFQANPHGSWTRSELHRVILRNAPVSSITRTLANLKSRGEIERTDDQRDGDFGVPMYTWRLANRNDTQTDMFAVTQEGR